MAKIGLISEANVPEGMMAKITVREDIDNDGSYENEATQILKDGHYVYELDGFQGERENGWSPEITLGRDPNGPSLSPTRDNPQPPSISSFQIIISGPEESGEIDPKAIVHKFNEADYFLYQMKNGPPEAYHFHLGAFLNAIYAIDDIIETDWSEWSESQAQADLHDVLLHNRHQSVHLRKPSKGSLKPPLGHSLKYDFGDSIEESLLESTYYFFDVPTSVVNEFVPKEERISLAREGELPNDSPFARIVPATAICQIYFSLLQERLTDWLRGLENDDYPYDLENLY